MTNIYSFKGVKPVIHPGAFVHPNATVTGNVVIGDKVYIGPGAAIRGDWGKIIIADGCNVQENCTIHMFPGTVVELKRGAHIGHGAVIHGATIGENSLIGMNAVVMDDAIIEAECIIGALSFIPAEMRIKKRSLAVGNPAKVIRAVSDEMLDWKTKGTALYQQLPEDYRNSLTPCEPLRVEPENAPELHRDYETWKSAKKA